ncbi:MAG: hypothetical protein ABIG61_02380 [Planctomycetota bacterium]
MCRCGTQPNKLHKKASVLVITVFVIALLSTVIMGMLRMTAQEIQIAQNRIYAAQALALAEAGLNQALAEIRLNKSWYTSTVLQELDDIISYQYDDFVRIVDRTLGNGSYQIYSDGQDHLLITARTTLWQNYTASIEAELTIGDEFPFIIRIDSYKVNK